MEDNITGFNLSVDTYKKAKALKMKDPRYYIYASLRGSGMSMRDSWAVAFQGQGFNWDKAVLEREMNKLESLESVQTRIAEIQGKKSASLEEDVVSPEQLAKATSKEQILKDLVIVKGKYKPGSKEWTEAVKMIADYNKIKQDEMQTEDTTVHFYIPAQYPVDCQSCLIFKNGKSEFQQKKKS